MDFNLFWMNLKITYGFYKRIFWSWIDLLENRDQQQLSLFVCCVDNYYYTYNNRKHTNLNSVLIADAN